MWGEPRGTLTRYYNHSHSPYRKCELRSDGDNVEKEMDLRGKRGILAQKVHFL